MSPTDPETLGPGGDRDPFLTRVSEVVGGPLGTRAGHHRWWTARRGVLALAVVTLLVGLLVPGPLGSADHPGRVRLVLLVVGVLATTWALATASATDSSRGWAAAGWAAAPILAVHWDEPRWLAAAAAVAGLLWLAAATRRDVTTWARWGVVVLGPALVVALVAPGIELPPAAALVLLPVAALGVRRWRDLLVWQGGVLLAELVAWWSARGWLSPTAGGADPGPWIAGALRGGAHVWLVLVAAWLLWAGRARRGRGSGHDDAVEEGGGEPHPYVDLLTDGGDAGA